MKKEFWIFVDGGAKKKEGGFHGSYGYIVTEAPADGRLKEIKRGGNYFGDTTTPRMEFMAVAHALTFVNAYVKENNIEGGEIHVVADALNTVQSMKTWIFGWVRNIKDGIMRRKDRETNKLVPVLNQDVIATAYQLVLALTSNFKVFFLHINSHIDEKKYEAAYIKFQEFNNMMISREDFDVLVGMNSAVDDLVNEIHEKGIKNGKD